MKRFIFLSTSLPLFFTLCLTLVNVIHSDEPLPWWTKSIEKKLVESKSNRKELEKALNNIPKEQRAGMVFLLENMPISDLENISAKFLITNHLLAYKAKQEVPWGDQIPDELFFNNVLAYANLDEKRDPWRQEFYDLCMPLIKSCKTPSEVAGKLNAELFKTLKLKYAPQRRPPNLSPSESILQGNASCTGLSIVLSDACRSVCVPARLAGTPNWFDKRGNHTWVEIWDKDWHFTGACEPDPKGLDRGWFVGDAAKAQKDSPEHAIYAASFRKTEIHFPLVWNRESKRVFGENVTDRYAKPDQKKSDTFQLNIKILDSLKKRIAVQVEVADSSDMKLKFNGVSRSESADLNDFLSFQLKPLHQYKIKWGTIEKQITTGNSGTQQLLEFFSN